MEQALHKRRYPNDSENTRCSTVFIRSARFGSTYTKTGTMQRKLAWPLYKGDTHICEAFHIFMLYQPKY